MKLYCLQPMTILCDGKSVEHKLGDEYKGPKALGEKFLAKGRLGDEEALKKKKETLKKKQSLSMRTGRVDVEKSRLKKIQRDRTLGESEELSEKSEPSLEEAKPKKRKRRTKAEIEAEKQES